MSTDKKAIQAVQQGDRDRFAELVDRHQKMVYGIAWSHLGDPDICEDAAQETFIKAYRYLGALRDPEKFPFWLARIARNVCTTILRKRQRELKNLNRWQMEQPTPSTEETSNNTEENLSELLGSTMAELQPDHRECLTLFYLEGKSVRETAEVLGVSESTVKTRLHRARKTLRNELDKRIETQLENLSPDKDFTASVMVILPQSGVLGTIGVGSGTSLLTKLSFGGWKALSFLSFFIWNTLGSATFMYFYLRWFEKLFTSNLTEKYKKDFHESFGKREVLLLCISIFFVLSLTHLGIHLIGFQAIYLILAAWLMIGLYRSFMLLRVAKTGWALGHLLSILTFFVTSLLIGLFKLPFVTFFFGMVFLNIALLFTNRNAPQRKDYNIFLRYIKGYLGKPGHTHPPIKRLTRHEQWAFARFLGKKAMAGGAYEQGDTLIIQLPTIQKHMRHGFLMSFLDDSIIKIQKDGHCQAIMGKRGHNDLESLLGEPINKQEIEEAVTQVVSQCLSLFLEGDNERANNLLSNIPEEEISKKPYHKSKAYWTVHGIGIVCSILVLILNLYFMSWNNPRPASREMAVEAFQTWINEDNNLNKNFQFRELWRSSSHPSLEYIGKEAAPQYQTAIAKALNPDKPKAPTDNTLFNHFTNPDLLYHTIATPLLSDEELENIGYTHQRIRSALTPMAENSFERSKSYFTNQGNKYTSLNIKTFSRQVYIMEHFNCLDLLDTDEIAKEISRYQVGDSFQPPKDFPTVNTELADGLIITGLRPFANTYSALLTLDLMGELDKIDQEACIVGIMRFYDGTGTFRSEDPLVSCSPINIKLAGNEEEALYALESLAILDAHYWIPGLQHWEFHPRVSGRYRVNGKDLTGKVTARTLTTWAWQERLKQRQQEVKNDPHPMPTSISNQLNTHSSKN